MLPPTQETWCSPPGSPRHQVRPENSGCVRPALTLEPQEEDTDYVCSPSEAELGQREGTEAGGRSSWAGAAVPRVWSLYPVAHGNVVPEKIQIPCTKS